LETPRYEHSNTLESDIGHTRLGEVPKTHKWNELVDRISGSGRTGNVATADVSVGVIAAQTLDATQKSLKRAATDPGVRYTFYLIAQVALAARVSNWETALDAHGNTTTRFLVSRGVAVLRAIR
jgi:hypothetical protein